MTAGAPTLDQRFLESILAAATRVAIIATDVTGVIRHFNSGAELMLGYTTDEIVGLQTPAIFHEPSEIEEHVANVARELNQPAPDFGMLVDYVVLRGYHEREWTWIRRDGARLVVHLALTPLRSADGTIHGLLGIAHDITARIEAERRLEQSRQRFQTLASLAPVGIFLTHPDGTCSFVNERWCEQAGLTAEDALGWGWKKALCASDAERVYDKWRAAARERIPYVDLTRFERPDGGLSDLHVEARPLFDERQELFGYIGVSTDLTAYHEAQRAVNHKAASLQTLADAAAELASLSLEGGWDNYLGAIAQQVEQRFQAVLTLTDEYVPLGTANSDRPSSSCDSAANASAIEPSAPAVQSLPLVHAGQRLGALTLPSREAHDLADHAITVQFSSILAAFVANARRHEQSELQRRRADDELARQRAELAHGRTLNSLGHLAAELAHELNQPLHAVLNYARGALRWLPQTPGSPEPVAEALRRIVEQAERGSAIIHQLRKNVDKRPLSKQWLAVDPLLNQVVRLLHAEAAEHHVTVSVDCETGLPPVLADSVQLEQVVFNLLKNSLEALAAGPAHDRRVRLRGARDGDCLRISILDNGPGVQLPEAEIFEPFVTTKAAGLGMGLSISRALVEAHGGRLWLENPGVAGACFVLSLPL